MGDYFQTYSCLLKKNFTKDKNKWLKLRVSRFKTRLKRGSSTIIFLWISHIFSKNFSYRTLLDDCVCWFLCSNQGFITLLWSHFFLSFVLVFFFYYSNSWQGDTSPSFLRHPPLKIFVYLRLFSVPPAFKVLWTVFPTLKESPLVLIWSTNLPWFKQISRERFYQFNCHFLSKINF